VYGCKCKEDVRNAEHHADHGSLAGTPETPQAYKVWNVLNGLGDMAFAYSFSFILLEITVSTPCFCIVRQYIKTTMSDTYLHLR